MEHVDMIARLVDLDWVRRVRAPWRPNGPRLLAYVGAILVIEACAATHVPVSPEPPMAVQTIVTRRTTYPSRFQNVDVTPTYVDVPATHSVQVRFVNTTVSPLCFDREMWPSERGRLLGPADAATLSVGRRSFSKRAITPGMCWGGGEDCVFVLAPGASMHGALDYEMFRLPRRLWDKPKQLAFSLPGYFCSSPNVPSTGSGM